MTANSLPEQNAAHALQELVARTSPDVLGELLRDLTFVGEGFGCYSTFDVRDDAREWSEEDRRTFWRWCNRADRHFEPGELDEIIEDATKMGSGYSWMLGELVIDCCWYWDGDGTLCFRVLNEAEGVVRLVVNDDCKKDYRWRET